MVPLGTATSAGEKGRKWGWGRGQSRWPREREFRATSGASWGIERGVSLRLTAGRGGNDTHHEQHERHVGHGGVVPHISATCCWPPFGLYASSDSSWRLSFLLLRKVVRWSGARRVSILVLKDLKRGSLLANTTTKRRPFPYVLNPPGTSADTLPRY